jgi:hypothetical protein
MAMNIDYYACNVNICITVFLALESCPVPVGIGAPSCGKSTAMRLVRKLMGMNIVSQSSGEFVVSNLTVTTIPVCWDDPTYATCVRQPLMAVFNGLGNQTQARGDEKPKTSFLLTVNFTLDDDLRY